MNIIKDWVLKGVFFLLSFGMFGQHSDRGGASAHSDAIHAFDDSNGGGSGSFGFGVFVLLIIMFLIALVLWGKTMGNKK